MSYRSDEAEEVSDAEVEREDAEAGDDEPSDGVDLEDIDDEEEEDNVYRPPPKRRFDGDTAHVAAGLDRELVGALKRHIGQLRHLVGNPNPMTQRDCDTIRRLKRAADEIN